MATAAVVVVGVVEVVWESENKNVHYFLQKNENHNLFTTSTYYIITTVLKTFIMIRPALSVNFSQMKHSNERCGSNLRSCRLVC